MYWVTQQRYVAWLLAGIAPALLAATRPASSQPSVMPGLVVSASDDRIDGSLDLFVPPIDDPAETAPAASQAAQMSQAPSPQPIYNPVPPAFWSGLSVLALVTTFLALRRLRTQLW